MSMEYEKLPNNVFDQIALGAGTLLTDFDMTTKTVDRDDILFPTSGGITFTDKPNFVDFGEDIDNCPKNTKELKRIKDREIKLSGTAVGNTPSALKLMAAAADLNSTTGKITPRDVLDLNDFADLWFVVDYSSVNKTVSGTGGSTAGIVAIHIFDALSTGGVSIVTTDAEKAKFAFEFTAHYSIDDPDTVPYEMYAIVGSKST